MANTKEHWIIETARTMPLACTARSELRCQLVGGLREIVRHHGLVSEYRDLIAAHEVAESVLDERVTAEANRIPPLPQKPVLPTPPAPREKVRLVMPGRLGSGPVLSQAERQAAAA